MSGLARDCGWTYPALASFMNRGVGKHEKVARLEQRLRELNLLHEETADYGDHQPPVVIGERDAAADVAAEFESAARMLRSSLPVDYKTRELASLVKSLHDHLDAIVAGFHHPGDRQE